MSLGAAGEAKMHPELIGILGVGAGWLVHTESVASRERAHSEQRQLRQRVRPEFVAGSRQPVGGGIRLVLQRIGVRRCW